MFTYIVLILSILGSFYVNAEVGGSIAADGQFSYMVSFRSDGSHKCGGIIVAEEWILTAGHCVYNKSPEHMSIYVGSNNLTTGGREYAVDRVFIHEDFYYILLHNDIAMLHLSKPIDLITNHATIANLTPTPVPDGAVIVAPGWGHTSLFSKYPEQLQFLTFTKISQFKCLLGGLPSWSTNLCTLSETGTGLCGGDSGSPAVYQNMVVGVASYTLPCVTILPNVYTDATQYYEWVQNKIRAA